MKYLSLCVSVSLVAGCSSVSNIMDVTNLVDYSDHKSVKVMEMPPGLKAPKFNNTYLTTASDHVSKTTTVSTDVPLVDGSLTAPSLSQVRIVTRNQEPALQLDDTQEVWAGANDALKAMGLTILKSDKAGGTINVRDRSMVSDPASPIGAFLNRTMGKMNQGKKYQVSVSQEGTTGFIVMRNEAGKSLSAAEAKLLLKRLQKEYVDTE